MTGQGSTVKALLAALHSPLRQPWWQAELQTGLLLTGKPFLPYDIDRIKQALADVGVKA